MDTLDQDLGLDGDTEVVTEDSKEKNERKVTSVGLKQTILNANKKDATSNDDDEVKIEDDSSKEETKTTQ